MLELMAKKTLASVIICTYNRSKILPDTLDSLLGQECDPAVNNEVIVVDNNSTDTTRQIVESYITAFGGKLKYVYEQRQGLSNARNAGVTNAKGDILVFTDDDCIVDKYWLTSIMEIFLKYNADCVFGKILPIWGSKKVPNWLANDRKLWGRLALLDYGDDVKIAESEKEQFFGANFAIKKQFLLDVGLFDPHLGRNGKKLFAGEDTVIFEKLLAFNKKIVYNPLAIVHHKIESERMQKQYFRKWHFFSGQSHVRSFDLTCKKVFGIPRWLIRKSLENHINYLKQMVLINKREAFRCQLKCIANLGMCVACFKEWAKQCQK